MNQFVLFLLTLFFYFSSSSFLMAQVKKSYKGEFKTEFGDVGEATYTYLLNETTNEHIKDGNFVFSASYEDSSACNQHIEKNYKGTYKKDLKEGQWTYDYNRYDLILKKIRVLNVTSTLYGSQSKVTANYKKGKANGKWTFSEKKVEDSKLSGLIREVTANYSEGNLTGSFSYSDFSNEKFPIEIKGSFNEEGNFDKTWILTFYKNGDKIEENRLYQNGFLLELLKKNLNKDSIIYELKYERVAEKLALLESFPDSNFNFSVGTEKFGVLFSDGYQSDSDLEKGQQLGNSYIINAVKIFCGPESEIFALNGVEEIKSGSTKRFRYEYSVAEQKAIQQLTENSKLLNKLTSEVLENKSYVINHQKNDSLALIYNYFNLVKEKSDSLSFLLEVFNSDIFQYKSRENYFAKGLPQFSSADTLVYDFDGESKKRVFNYNHKLEDGKNVIVNLAENVTLIADNVNAFYNYLQPYFQDFEKDKEMRALEEIMIEKSKLLQDLYLSNKDEQNTPLHDIIYERIAVSKRNRLMQDYSNAANYQEKELKANRILYLDSVLTEVYPALSEIYAMPKKLDEQFTNFAYNPYNGKYDIKTRVKKRIYTKVQEEMLPYLFQKLENETALEPLQANINEILNLNKKMTEISKKPDNETNKLERRARKEKDMDKLFKLIIQSF